MDHIKVPTVTRLDEWGHVRADFPHPPISYYPVAHEVIEQWVEGLNRIADLRQRLNQSDWIVCAEALRILEGNGS
jgi:hypothetical protein